MAAEGARALSDEDVALAVAENEAVEVGVPVVEWDGGEREAVKVRVRERERVRLRVGVPGKLRDGEAERDPVGLGLAVWVRQLDVVGVREGVVGAGSRRQTRLLAPPALGFYMFRHHRGQSNDLLLCRFCDLQLHGFPQTVT